MAEEIAVDRLDARFEQAVLDRPDDWFADWVPLRQAAESSGVSVSTLRKWHKRGLIPSRLRSTGPNSPQRLVRLDDVRERAKVVLANRPPAAKAPRQESEDAPAGGVLVPVDAWQKLLDQLGNLHDAGQQLAEARERAARAEVELEFMRIRLAELREEHERGLRSSGQRVATVQAPQEPQRAEAPALGSRFRRWWSG